MEMRTISSQNDKSLHWLLHNTKKRHAMIGSSPSHGNPSVELKSYRNSTRKWFEAVMNVL